MSCEAGFRNMAVNSDFKESKVGVTARIGRAPLDVVLGWASGSIGASAIALTYNLLLLRYLTDFLGIGAGLAGGMIAISKIYDAFVDPLIGGFSDRVEGRMGRRRPFILASAILCPIAMLAMFFVPQFGNRNMELAYVFGALLLYATAYAILSVPYMAMAAEITDDYRDRSRLIAFRTAAGTLGQVVAATGGPWLLVYWGGGRGAHERLAVALALVISASCLLCFFMTARARFHKRTSHLGPSYLTQIRAGWQNKPFRWLIISKFFFFGLSATSATSNAYFTKYILHTSDIWLGMFYVLLAMGTAGSLPIWLRLGKRFEKKPCILVALSMIVLVSLSWLLAGPGEPPPLLWARALGNGLALGGFILFGQSMLPDTVEHDFRRTGLRREGIFSGIFVLTEKISTAGGVAIIGLLLGLGGYVASSSHSGLVAQPASALVAIRFCFAVLPAAGAIACILALLPYNLTEASLKISPLDKSPSESGGLIPD